MARRTNNIRGPSSAMTDYIRSVGITPTLIARRAAIQQPPDGPTSNPMETEENSEAVDQEQPQPTASRPSRRRTRGNAEASTYDSEELDEPAPPPKKKKLTKAEEAKQKAKAKKKKKDEESEDEYTALSRNAFSNAASSSSKPPVGSFENCAKCEQQFTVTKYTMAANPGPGFLCHACAKTSGIDPFKRPAVPKRKALAEKRNVVHFEERRFPSLVSMCIQIVSKNINDIEAFGDIGTLNMEAISKAISKNRSLTSENAHLFYGAENTSLTLYDVTKLSPDALKTLGYLNPNLTSLRLDFCGCISNEVLESWATSLPNLISLQLLGPFLVRVPAWVSFFKAHPGLESFLITQSPRFDLDCLKALVETSGSTLVRLGLREVGKVADDFLHEIKALEGHLEYLDLSEPAESCSDKAVIDLLSGIGSTLTTLNLSGHIDLTDNALHLGIARHCNRLSSLVLSNLPELTDAGVAQFFSEWRSNGPLSAIDLSRSDLLATNALLGLLEHSGEALQHVNINGWKDVGAEALAEIVKQAPKLIAIDVGWCREMDDFILKELVEGSQIKEVKVWGCNRVEGKWTSNGKRQRPVRVFGIENHSSV